MADVGEPGYGRLTPREHFLSGIGVLGPVGGAGSIDPMSEPRLFQQVTVTIDVWAPRGSGIDIHTVADKVQLSASNAVEAAMKEIELPDQGLEVVVR